DTDCPKRSRQTGRIDRVTTGRFDRPIRHPTARPIWRSLALFCMHERHPIRLDPEAGQTPGRVGPRIDVDSVGVDLGLEDRRMPVNYDFSKILLAAEKLVADPQQVSILLAGKRNAGTDASVSKKEITAHVE